MASIPNDFPTSLRSWPASNTNDSTSLPNLIQRINIERGGFRHITEESLRQEIAEAEAGAGSGEEDGSSDEEDEEEEPDRKKELETAKVEMQAQLQYVLATAPRPLCSC
jgi:mediator of RNA polymerase II transcription subunit 17